MFEEPINPWDNSNYRGELSPALLGTNMAINSEARLLLYQNRFDFTPISSNGVSSFLENIGRDNADCIRYIAIEFPSFRGLELGSVTIGDDDIRILEVIQSNCAKLKTLAMSRHSTNIMEHRLDELDNPKIAAEALTLVNTRFRAISSLQDIIVEVYEDAPSDYIRRQIESHGWTISAAEYVEEWGGSSDYDWDRYDDYEWDLYEDDDHHGEYDYEYDSDFWRRAAD